MADIKEQETSENLSRKEENQNEKSHDHVKITFEEGQLSYLGADVDHLPKEIIKNYSKITSQLDLSFNKLRSLSGVEHFTLLKELVLDNNELSDNIFFPPLTDLHTLTLNKNMFSDLHGLLEKLIQNYPNLTYLSLLGNKACPNELSASDKDDEDYQRYRYYVLYKLPGLKFLDSTPVTANEVGEAKRVGPYMLVVRPKEHEPEQVTADVPTESPTTDRYNPLPSSSSPDYSNHQAYWAKSKSKYTGRNSEGNRFITDAGL